MNVVDISVHPRYSPSRAVVAGLMRALLPALRRCSREQLMDVFHMLVLQSASSTDCKELLASFRNSAAKAFGPKSRVEVTR